MFKEREIMYFLQTVPGIGNKSIRQLWKFFKTGERIFAAEEQELNQILKPNQVKTFLQEREKASPKERMKKLEQKGIDYYSVFDKEYPLRLRAVADFPLALFVKGKLPKEHGMTAAVVGARNHSYYGEKYTKLFAGRLAEEEIGVISGMARGIDSIAQKSVLEHGGDTYAILGCGVDICYPGENRRLYEEICEHGGIISEYLPGTEPKASLFPMRNRIISALGDILLVMEARARSGTLITVDMALEQGKEIWALPGRTDDVLSYGCNRLIAQGAGILTGIEEFSGELELLKEKYTAANLCNSIEKKEWFEAYFTPEKLSPKEDEEKKVKEEKTHRVETKSGEKVVNHLTKLQQAVLGTLDYSPMSVNQIYEKLRQNNLTQTGVEEISVLLIDLCIKNLAKQVNGNWYIRT